MNQREIKFRAWNRALKRYKFPELWDNSMPSNWQKLNTLQQYTGLKDKNGTDIYEGDILTTPTRFVHDTLDAYGVVTYLGTGFTSVGFGDFAGAHYRIQYDSEVIGNVFEHPHLLENAMVQPSKTPEA